MTDKTQALQDIVQEAFANKQTLMIKGSGSKNFYGFAVKADQSISTREHQGIVSYQPNELVLTARAGTPLKEIEACLAEKGQMLSCEAPHFGLDATFGGMIASGLSGPMRPFGSSVSDLVLGCKIINGKAEVLNFGGKVMKNVAGYDNSRLMVGSMGCLGLILETTVKVVPKTQASRSYRFSVEQGGMLAFMNKLASLAYPVSASAHDGEALVVRFSAGEKEIENLKKSLQNDFSFCEFSEEILASYWDDIKEHRSEFFKTDKNIWRLSLPANAQLENLPGETLFEWNGSQRWLKTNAKPKEVFDAVEASNGSASLFSNQNLQNLESVFQPLPSPLMQWQHTLKSAFDPAGIFNPGRMYRGL